MNYRRKTIYLAEHKSIEADAIAAALGMSDGKLFILALKELKKGLPPHIIEKVKGYVNSPETMPVSVFKQVGGLNRTKCKVLAPSEFKKPTQE